MKHVTLSILLGTFLVHLLPAQCPFDPTVLGDTLLCGTEQTSLSTQTYDTYQWYSRPFGSGNPAAPIAGATGQSLPVTEDLYLTYVSVEATLNGCTERSPEVLIDLYAFLPVTVQTAGNFQVGPNGEALLCPGDTLYLIMLLPYTINIQWSNNGMDIPGATDDTLVVTQPGSYTVEGSPEVCPDIVNQLGLSIDVVPGTNCVTSTKQPGGLPALAVSATYLPQMEGVRLQSTEPDMIRASLWDLGGRLIGSTAFQQQGDIHTGRLSGGVYIVRLQAGNRMATIKMLVPGG